MKAVLYSCPFVPPEWIAAHGLVPVRCLGAESAAATPPDARAAEAGRGIPKAGVCPFAREFAAQCLAASADESPAAAIFTTACDQLRRMSEAVAAEGRLSVFLMNVPATWQGSGPAALYLSELRRLGQFLVKLGGHAPSDHGLARVMCEYDEARRALRQRQPSMSARQFAAALADLPQTVAAGVAAVSAANPATKGRRIDLHDARFARLVPGETAGETPATPVSPAGPALALAGGPLLRRDWRIYDLVEQLGGRIVLDATESGELSLPPPLERRGGGHNALSELAGLYFGALPHAFRRPNSQWFGWLARALPARCVRGILYVRYVWCDTWHAEAQRLREWSHLPVVEIELADDANDLAAIRQRVGAMVEMLMAKP